MLFKESHLSDRELLMAVDGWFSARNQRIRCHLSACSHCRARKQKIEAAFSEFSSMHRKNFDIPIPPAAAPRALLKARLSQLSESQQVPYSRWFSSWRPSLTIVAAACGLVALAYLVFLPLAAQRAMPVAVTIPDPAFTPGATVLVSASQVCRQSNTNNKAVPVSLRRKVFYEYGIRHAEPSAYEIDYLITPALGGADDIHNMWPESSRGTLWNAQVKDSLEEHLRDMVCDGQLDLATAQHEIASNWIEAYKKYFHTDRPRTPFR